MLREVYVVDSPPHDVVGLNGHIGRADAARWIVAIWHVKEWRQFMVQAKLRHLNIPERYNDDGDVVPAHVERLSSDLLVPYAEPYMCNSLAGARQCARELGLALSHQMNPKPFRKIVWRG